MSVGTTQPFGHVGSINSTPSIGEKPDDTPNSKEQTIVIFTDSDPRHQEFANLILEACTKSHLAAEHLTVKGADLPEKIEELRKQGRIGDGTQIIIDLHGAMNGEHLIDNKSVATIDVVKAVRKEDESGKKCSANVYITACNAGDSKLRTQIETLHKSQPTGACYLMSGKKDVFMQDYQPELLKMCNEIANAKRNNEGTPSEHLIFTKMTEYQADCISMINRDGVTIRHAPKIDKHFALAGLIADIENRLQTKAEPSGQPGNEADGKRDASSLVKADEGTPGTGGETGSTGKEQKKEKARLLASEAVAEKLRLAAKALEGSPPDESLVAWQAQRALKRRVDRAPDGEKLVEALRSNEGFWNGFQTNTWNESHAYALTGLLPIVTRYSEDQSGSKNKFFELLNAKRHLFTALDPDSQREIIHTILYRNLCALINEGFFDGPAQIGELNAEFESIEAMKEYFESDSPLIESLQSNQIETSHFLTAAMLFHCCKKAESDQRTQEIEYLCQLLTLNAEEFMKEGPLEDLISFLSWIPRPSPEPSVFSLLRKMFLATRFDKNSPRGIERRSLIQKHLEPQLEDWVAQADRDETLWVREHYDGDPKFERNKWADCHYSLIRMLDGALRDTDDARRADKVDICKVALQPKLNLFLRAGNRQRLINQMHDELRQDTIGLLMEMGFIPRPAPPPSRKRSAPETTDKAPPDQKERRVYQ